MAVATPIALVTVEEVRQYSLRDPLDDSLDGLWNLLIPGVSEAACLWADRQFYPQDGVTRAFGGMGWAGRIVLSPWELREATAVLLDGAATDAWALFPVGGTTQGTYWTLALDSECAVVEVTGDWGMETVPPAARHAVLIAIDAYYQNAAGHASESLGGHSFSEVLETFAIGGLPRASRTLLDNYRRISVT